MKDILEKFATIISSIDKFLMAFFILGVFGVVVVYPMVIFGRSFGNDLHSIFWVFVSIYGIRFSFVMFHFWEKYTE